MNDLSCELLSGTFLKAVQEHADWFGVNLHIVPLNVKTATVEGRKFFCLFFLVKGEGCGGLASLAIQPNYSSVIVECAEKFLREFAGWAGLQIGGSNRGADFEELFS
ncbi:MAG: hypothetical protein LBB14_02240 [Puniceicoccales bacterium]|nr:hypothetical protein [Puniceicoccales bacterium]